MLKQLFCPAAAILLVSLASPAAPGDVGLSPPTGYRQWFHVNTAIVDKASPLFEMLGGMHNIYINADGLPALEKGGPFPDGSIFTDDIHEFTVSEGVYVEGSRKGIAVMVKDAQKFGDTGGWRFELWASGDRNKPIVTDAATQCFACHTQRQDHDFVFSTYLP
jgi:Cytochrome P460